MILVLNLFHKFCPCKGDKLPVLFCVVSHSPATFLLLPLFSMHCLESPTVHMHEHFYLVPEGAAGAGSVIRPDRICQASMIVYLHWLCGDAVDIRFFVSPLRHFSFFPFTFFSIAFFRIPIRFLYFPFILSLLLAQLSWGRGRLGLSSSSPFLVHFCNQFLIPPSVLTSLVVSPQALPDGPLVGVTGSLLLSAKGNCSTSPTGHSLASLQRESVIALSSESKLSSEYTQQSSPESVGGVDTVKAGTRQRKGFPVP